VTLLLYLKFYVINVRWALQKGRAGQRAPEDTSQNLNPNAHDKAAADHTGRIVANDLENIPFGLIMLWACIISVLFAPALDANLNDNHLGDLYTATIALAIIAGARTLHTIVFSLAVPPPTRSIFFVIAQMAVFGLGMVAVIAASLATNVAV
jgi:hypothetical protein